MSGKVLAGISYEDANAGEVKFVADGEEPRGYKPVTIQVKKSDDEDKNGSGMLVVKDRIKLKLISPRLNALNDTITNEPQMPIDTCKAVLLNYTGGQVTFEWEYHVNYEIETREGAYTFTDLNTVVNSDTSVWLVNFLDQNGQPKFIGGEVSVMVKAITPDTTYCDTLTNVKEIIGENPTPQQAREDVDIELHVVMYKESRFRQFDTDGYTLVGPSRPNADFGICQLCNPPPDEKHIWNWLENRTEGERRLEEKNQEALGYPERVRARGGFYSNATDFITDEQIWKETFQRYNFGNYWEWEPDNMDDPNTPGQWNWVPRPANDYGNDSWRIYNDIRNGNYPNDWN